MVHWLTLIPAWLSGLAFGVWLARAIRPRIARPPARRPVFVSCPQCDERELRSLGSSPGGVYCPNCGWDISVEQLS